jgi:hypothetical protein
MGKRKSKPELLVGIDEINYKIYRSQSMFCFAKWNFQMESSVGIIEDVFLVHIFSFIVHILKGLQKELDAILILRLPSEIDNF